MGEGTALLLPGGVKVRFPTQHSRSEVGVAPDCSWVGLGWELRLHVVGVLLFLVGHR